MKTTLPSAPAATASAVHQYADADGGLLDLAEALIVGRQNVSPKRLVEPGPSEQQLGRMLTMAAAAPDHGQLVPWRFVIVPAHKRELLAGVFVLALIDRDPGATLLQIEAAREIGRAHV